MLNLQHRIDLLLQLGKYIQKNEPDWQAAKHKATAANGWFMPEFIDIAITNIEKHFLNNTSLLKVAEKYKIPQDRDKACIVGIVMAGNIPLVGFHDWLCVFLSGHIARIKLSTKDNILLKHLLDKISEWDPEASNHFQFSEILKGCDAYVATGSDNSARYFEYYFNRFPSIIRRNRTSVAILSGHENSEDLERLADDINLFFGLGCRNVTKIFVPQGFDFVPLLEAMNKYKGFSENNKYQNNYDYQLAIHLLNKQYYMTNGTILLSESTTPFSPISQLNYEFYTDREKLLAELKSNNSIQCIVGQDQVQFGQAQSPGWDDFADGVDTMSFLQGLNKQ